MSLTRLVGIYIPIHSHINLSTNPQRATPGAEIKPERHTNGMSLMPIAQSPFNSSCPGNLKGSLHRQPVVIPMTNVIVKVVQLCNISLMSLLLVLKRHPGAGIASHTAAASHPPP